MNIDIQLSFFDRNIFKAFSIKNLVYVLRFWQFEAVALFWRSRSSATTQKSFFGQEYTKNLGFQLVSSGHTNKVFVTGIMILSSFSGAVSADDVERTSPSPEDVEILRYYWPEISPHCPDQ